MMTEALYVLNTELILELSKINSPDSWSSAPGFLYGLSVFVNNYDAICAVPFAVIISLISWSLPNWRNPDGVRTFADKIMPWGIYQDIQGATSLLSMAALLRVKMTTLNSSNILQEFTSPWLSTCLDSIICHIRQGGHLGLALHQYDYQFPSREAANLLSLLQGDGTAELASNYDRQWPSQALQRARKQADMIHLTMLTFLVMSLMLLVFAIMDIQSISDDSMGNF